MKDSVIGFKSLSSLTLMLSLVEIINISLGIAEPHLHFFLSFTPYYMHLRTDHP